MLRMYPPHFGCKLVRLFRSIVDTRCGPPELPDTVAKLPTQEFFDGLPWTTDMWDDAGMMDVLAYARGNKSLNLGTWRSSFPQSF